MKDRIYLGYEVYPIVYKKVHYGVKNNFVILRQTDKLVCVFVKQTNIRLDDHSLYVCLVIYCLWKSCCIVILLFVRTTYYVLYNELPCNSHP